MNIPLQIKKLMNRLDENHQVYLVGGFVRDSLWGQETTDIDLCTDAPLDTLIKSYSDKGPSIFKPYGIKFIDGDYHVEISIMRQEFDYDDLRHPRKIVPTDDIEVDVLRRDFTINAIYCDSSGRIYDPLQGVRDAKNQVLRVVGDANQRFNEDALRVLRFFRLKSQHNLSYDVLSYQSAKENTSLLKQLSLVQIREELFKFIMGDSFLETVLDCPSILMNIFNEYKQAYDFNQKNAYHRYTLFEHSVRVVANSPKILNVRVAALFHDLGKLETQVLDADGVGHYPRHALKSKEIASFYLDAMQISKKDKTFILSLIERHAMRFERNRPFFQSLIRERGVFWVQCLLALKRADNLSKSDLAHYQIDNCDEFDAIVNQIITQAYPTTIDDLAINSKELMDLGIPKRLLSKVRNDVLDKVIQGELENSKDEIIDYCKEVCL